MRSKTTTKRSYDLVDLPEEYVRNEFPEYYDSMKKLKIKDTYMYLHRLS